MGISNPQSINLVLQPVNWQNKAVSGALKPSMLTAYNLPVSNYETSSNLVLQKMYPMSDGETDPYSHHRCAHPGMRWECPVHYRFLFYTEPLYFGL